MQPENVYDGFRRSPVGLFVPEEYSRERQAFTWQEWRDIERVTRLLTSRQVKFLMACDTKGCPDPKLERIRNLDGSITLRCGCRDRVFTRAF